MFAAPDLIVSQYCAGGEFFSLLKCQENERLSETQARFYAAEVLLALEYLHLLGIIYRDLKPENILVHESGHVMLSDFDLAHELKPSLPIAVSPSGLPRVPSLSSVGSQGATNPLWFRMAERRKCPTSNDNTGHGRKLVRRRSCCAQICSATILYPTIDTESHLDEGERRLSFVGTHEYVAPELIAEEGYAGSVDWWAFGILLYEMLFGTTPFKGDTKTQTLENILDITESIEFPPDVVVSDECKDLLRQLLAKFVPSRLQNPMVIKAHPFFKEVTWPRTHCNTFHSLYTPLILSCFALNAVIRHQQPPISPTFVHSLKEKEFPRDKGCTVDDEIPYASGVATPRTAGQKTVVKCAPVALTEQQVITADSNSFVSSKPAPTATPVSSSATDQKGTANPRPSRTSSSTRTLAVSAYVSASRNPSTDRSNTNNCVVHPLSIAPTCQGSSTTDTATSAVVLDFDYAGSPTSSYWRSDESHRTLTAKLSGLDKCEP